MYTSELRLLHYLAPINSYYEQKTALRFNNSILTITQNIYKIKIVTVYIVNDLDHWPENLLDNFRL